MKDKSDNEKFLWIVKNALQYLDDEDRNLLVFEPEYTGIIYERAKFMYNAKAKQKEE